MFNLPQTTYFGKLIPKTKFYNKLTIDKNLERSFIDQIASIRWLHKLSADTLNVEKGKTVEEVEVFLIKLKTGELDENVLRQMDKQLPYHLIFVLEYSDKYQLKKVQMPHLKSVTTEMETGVGKTYTYIKTMYELNKAYGWSKFIVVVPSVAIREGVYKSFEITQEHFAEEYGKKIRFFIYNSSRLTEIDRFASDSNINVMIINSQAFNAKGKDARRIYPESAKFMSSKYTIISHEIYVFLLLF